MKAGAERFFRTSDYWKAWSAVPDLTPDIGYALRAVRPSDRRVLDVPAERGEPALGADASEVLPEAIRTRELPARLPGYQVAMLAYLAEQRQTSVSNVLARELDDLASAHFEELSSAVHGFAEAFEWPRRDATQRPW